MQNSEPKLTDEAKFVRWVYWGGLLVIAMFSLGKLTTIAKYFSWKEGSGIYEGSNFVSSSRSGGALSCERRYTVDPRTDLEAPPTGPAATTVRVDSPCLVLVGPRHDIGQRVRLRVHPNQASGAMSSTEAFGLGIFEILPVLVALGAHLVRRRMLARGSWFQTTT